MFMQSEYSLGGAMELEFYVYIATSLDGFIARTDGKIDWLETANEGEEAESGGKGVEFADFEFDNSGNHLFACFSRTPVRPAYCRVSWFLPK